MLAYDTVHLHGYYLYGGVVSTQWILHTDIPAMGGENDFGFPTEKAARKRYDGICRLLKKPEHAGKVIREAYIESPQGDRTWLKKR